MDIAIRLCRMRDGLLPRELSVCTFPTAQNLSVSLMRNGLPFGVLPVCTFPTGAHLSDRCAPFRPVRTFPTGQVPRTDWLVHGEEDAPDAEADANGRAHGVFRRLGRTEEIAPRRSCGFVSAKGKNAG